jgi:1-acyl-sn-glycerol-3-phosphate acyltransferase
VTTFIAALRSIVTYVAVSLYVVLAGPPLLLVALLLGSPSILYQAGRFGVRLGLFLSGIRFVVEGKDRILLDRAAVYAVNHASNVEPPIIFEVLHQLFPRLRAFDLAGFVPLERGNRDQSLPAIERAAQALREGNSFLIFPEGTRSRTGQLLPFKKGGFIMAVKGQAPIVPVAIVGARRAMRKGSPIIYPVLVHVRFGEPAETAGLTIEDRDSLISTVRGRVEAMLDEV